MVTVSVIPHSLTTTRVGKLTDANQSCADFPLATVHADKMVLDEK
jgi:hypothetical protein